MGKTFVSYAVIAGCMVVASWFVSDLAAVSVGVSVFGVLLATRLDDAFSEIKSLSTQLDYSNETIAYLRQEVLRLDSEIADLKPSKYDYR